MPADQVSVTVDALASQRGLDARGVLVLAIRGCRLHLSEVFDVKQLCNFDTRGAAEAEQKVVR